MLVHAHAALHLLVATEWSVEVCVQTAVDALWLAHVADCAEGAPHFMLSSSTIDWGKRSSPAVTTGKEPLPLDEQNASGAPFGGVCTT